MMSLRMDHLSLWLSIVQTLQIPSSVTILFRLMIEIQVGSFYGEVFFGKIYFPPWRTTWGSLFLIGKIISFL